MHPSGNDSMEMMDNDDVDNEFDGASDGELSDRSSSESLDRAGTGSANARHTKLTDLEAHVRALERENLHLKQTLLLGKSGVEAAMAARNNTISTQSLETTQHLLDERTQVVQEMVEQLNAPVLSLADASQVWHEECRIGVGVREWDALGRLEAISLWSMIRSIFANIAVDIVELRPHLPDGEMILTKWRVQGEIASAPQLQAICASEDCPDPLKVALQSIKSNDLTFTVTAYVIFEDMLIAEQHHCWDQVGVFKRLFGGEIPASVQQILTVTDEEQDEE